MMLAPYDRDVMAPNETTTTEAESETEFTVVVDPDDIVEAFKRNRRDENEQRDHVLKVSPPFAGEVKASLHVDEHHTRYPPEVDVTPLHLPPALFVNDQDGPYTSHTAPRYSESVSLARDDHGQDVDQETIDEYHEVGMGVWEETVRAHLRDEITLRNVQRTNRTIAVEYED